MTVVGESKEDMAFEIDFMGKYYFMKSKIPPLFKVFVGN
jgi:hypothetical protein